MRNFILTALALAMGVASVVLGILKAEPSTTVILLGIGLFAVAASLLPKREK